jgi:hypothetical protein
MKIGFTGSREGMSDSQVESFYMLLGKMGMTEFHHGDCMGADAEAHMIVQNSFPDARIVVHPPKAQIARAYCVGDELRPQFDYLTRDKNIVDECEFLFAAPMRSVEEVRSGTWATVRYARKKFRLHVVLPR